jgi:hypothetical protein
MKEKFNNLPYVNCPPKASAHIEGIRAYGYNPPKAIADIIDNSITAKAKNIWIIYNFNKINPLESKIAVLDDGQGMKESELDDAMRLHSKNPTDKRSKEDLGRFGLGLKSASLSQSSTLTVRSKKDNDDNIRCWDLDYIRQFEEYRIIKGSIDTKSDFMLKLLDTFSSGTLVLWENLVFLKDHKEHSEQVNNDNFNQKVADIIRYCEVIFHRFINSEDNINIYACTVDDFKSKSQRNLKAWDPFFVKKSEWEDMQKTDKNNVEATIYTLPHVSESSESDREYMSGIYGMLEHQGFYIYRNKRLLIPGGWLGLDKSIKLHQSTNLARIKLDLPNHQDEDWRLTTNKSEVIPPDRLRKTLIKWAKLARTKAQNKFKHRAKISIRTSQTDTQKIWNYNKAIKGKYIPVVNRKHPFVNEVFEKVSQNKASKKDVENLLKLVEKKLPLEHIASEYDNDFKSFEIERQPKEFGFDIMVRFQKLYNEYLEKDLSEEEAFTMARATEPFDDYAAEIESQKHLFIKEDKNVIK